MLFILTIQFCPFISELLGDKFLTDRYITIEFNVKYQAGGLIGKKKTDTGLA